MEDKWEEIEKLLEQHAAAFGGIFKTSPDNFDYVDQNVLDFVNITSQMQELYSRKNRDYGSSFDKSLDEDGLLVSKIRLGDKYRRFSQLIKEEALVKDEKMEDTLMDMANYAILTIMWLRRQGEKK